MSEPVEKLGTYGKLMRAIWPELRIERGPIGLLDDVLKRNGTTSVQLVEQLKQLPELAKQYVETQARMEQRQIRVESQLQYLVDHIEAAKERNVDERTSSDGNGISHSSVRTLTAGTGADGCSDSAS